MYQDSHERVLNICLTVYFTKLNQGIMFISVII